MPAQPIVLTAATDLATSTTSERFGGREHGDGVEVSFFINHTPPGRSVSDHRHRYGEVFLLLDGEATFRVDGAEVSAHGGQVVVVPAGAMHAFTNRGAGTLEMISIHAAAEMATEWAEG